MTDFDTKLMIDTKSLNQKIEKAESSLNQFYRESHFEEDVTQNYLVFQPMDNYFKRISNTDYVLEQESKGLSDESIESPSAPKNLLDPSLDYYGSNIKSRIQWKLFKTRQKKYI